MQIGIEWDQTGGNELESVLNGYIGFQNRWLG